MAISIVSNSGMSPSFDWQAGNASNRIDMDGVRYRATIRPLPAIDATDPISLEVIYEETGIPLGTWTFPFETNLSLAGGPYRDYQIVIEAHDGQGNTSAGNLVGTMGETNWENYPNGFDYMLVYNPRTTGIQLQDNLPTIISGGIIETGNDYYKNNAYFGPNGDVVVQYSSGQFSNNLVGGYIYVATGEFEKNYALTGYGQRDDINPVVRGIFNFNPLDGYVYHPTVGTILFQSSNKIDTSNVTYGYVALSFFDRLDKAFIDNDINVGTGLYLSNIAKVYNNSTIGKLNLGGSNIVESVKFSGDNNPVGNWNNILVIASGTASGITSVIYTNILNYTGNWSS